jgi:hypothetical protein
MHIYATTKKPPEPTAIMNGLLYAKLRGNVFGEFEGALSFQEQGAFVNPDNSLRGHQNPQYDVIPPLHHLDRTSALAISLREAHRYTPKGSTGYTSEFRSLDYVSGLSSKLAHWFREYQTLYYAALKAESDLHKQAGVRVDVDMDVRYGEGIVEAFYAATGDFTGRTLGYQSSVPLSVQGIYDRVLTSMAPWLDIIDHEGWMMGENSAKEYIGIGSIPQTKQNVLCVSANAKDALFSFPWARVLTVPRARDLVRDRFMERVTEALEVTSETSQYITITEGDGVLMLPTAVAAAGWDAITDAIDGRDAISNRFGADTQSWLDQFYTTGDLAAALFSGELQPYESSRLSVMLSAPVAEEFNGDNYLMGSVVGNNGDSAIVGTRELSSVNGIIQYTGSGSDLYTNYITGTTNAIWNNDGTEITPWDLTDSSTPVHSLSLGVSDWLPNGVLYCGSVGSATAVNWIDIMRTLSLSLPISTRVILDKSGRKKKSLPSGVPTVSVDALMARALAYGQRDGYIATSSKAFNSKRLNRDEQEGPAFFNTLEVSGAESTGLTEAHYGHVSPIPAAYLNGWDRLDANAGKFIIEPGGTTVHLDGPLPSSFCGEWDAGRMAIWTPSFLPDSAATADNTVERFVARSLMSYPAYWSRVDGELYPRFIPDSDMFANHEYSGMVIDSNAKGTMNTGWQMITGQATVGGQQVVGYAGTNALESIHPVSGFTRGLASFLPVQARGLYNTTVVDYFPGGAECHRTAMQGTLVDPVTNVRLHFGGQEYTYVVSRYNPVGDAIHGTPCQTWFWDPTRSQIVGDSWTRWAGAYFDDVLPDPYMPYPVAQMTSTMSIPDLLAYEEISLRSTGLVGYTNGAIAANTNAGSTAGYRCFALNTELASAQRDANTSPGPSAVFPMNSGSRWRGAISAPGVVELAVDLEDGHNGANSSSSFSTFVNPFLVHMPVTNGCSSVGLGSLKPPSMQNVHRSTSSWQLDGNFAIMAMPTGSVMEAAVDATAADNYLTAVGLTPAGTPLGFMNVLEGQTLAPIAPSGLLQHGIAITGQGISFEGDVVTPGMLEPMKWFSSVFEPVETTVRNQLGDYWPITGVDDTTIQVARHIGSGLPAYNEDPAAREQASLLPSALIRLSNDWFQRGNGLINKHARMRRSSLINPWTRAAGADGIVDLMYANDGILPMFNAMVDAFRMNGGKFQKGLESSMFLEVHQAN